MTALALETRSFEVRETAAGSRTFSGIAVPWDTPADIAGLYTERIERGAVEIPTSGRVLLLWRHSDPIGVLTRHEDTPEGWRIEARISETPRGDEAYTLLRDGVIDELSIGFVPLEHREDDETGDITRTRIEVREVSLVPFGAYGADAPVTDVRALAASDTPNAAPAAESESRMTDTVTAAEVSELRDNIEELSRSITLLANRGDDTPATDTRSAGEFLRSLAAGDESALRTHERATEIRDYTGGTTADAVVKPQGLIDLARIFDASSGVLSHVFSTGNLPATGNSLEFVRVLSNTISVAEQEDEGDDISFGKIALETATVPIKTYAGGTQLTRQAIERSTVNSLNTSLEALATGAGARKKAALRSAYGSLVAAREGIAANGGVVVLGATLGASSVTDWLKAVTRAALKFETQNLAPEALVVSASVFEKFIESPEWSKVAFEVSGEKEAVGRLNLPGLTGNLASIPFYLDSGQAGDKAVFVNSRAIRQYDSPLVSLQDEAIVNLSKTFAVYRYGAVADEIPAGVVPVKLAAS